MLGRRHLPPALPVSACGTGRVGSGRVSARVLIVLLWLGDGKAFRGVEWREICG